MSTTFYPAAADVRPGDEIRAIGDLTLPAALTVTAARFTPAGRVLSLSDGSTVTVPTTAPVDLLPPF